MELTIMTLMLKKSVCIVWAKANARENTQEDGDRQEFRPRPVPELRRLEACCRDLPEGAPRARPLDF